MKALSLVVVLSTFGVGIAGCTKADPPPAPGDVKPAIVVAAPARVVQPGLEQVSTPTAPRDVFRPALTAPESTHPDSVLRVPAGTPGRYTLPVDSTTGDSFLSLSVRASNEDDVTAALRDIKVLSPGGDAINVRASRTLASSKTSATSPELDTKPMSWIAMAGHPTGTYTVDVGAMAAKFDITVAVKQPESGILLKVKPSNTAFLFGNDESVSVTVTENGNAVTGAKLTGYMLQPDGTRGNDLAFAEAGKGVYATSGLAQQLSASSAAGAYSFVVHAAGTSPSGASFLRAGATSMHFAVPTARILDASTTRIVRDAQGLVTAFEVDVTVDAKATDRYEISGILTAIGRDGLEHPVVEAQTADALDVGSHKLTLRFDAGYAQLTKLEGELQLRALQLFSQGTNALLHRATNGMNVRFAAVKHAELATLAVRPPMVDEMLRQGVYEAQ